MKGFNGGRQDKNAGKTTLRGDSLGVYWTLIGANQAYLDLVLMGTRFNGNNESDRGCEDENPRAQRHSLRRSRLADPGDDQLGGATPGST